MERRSFEHLHAPYNFVPLSKHVRTDWGSDPSHDLPFRDGLCGCIAIAITTDSPLLVSGDSEERSQDGNQVSSKHFFRLPDDTPAIPGSSLRGMIRNVVEIIGFSKFQMVDDRRFGLRDLTPAASLDYREKFAETVGSRTYRARSCAGWLRKERGKSWKIIPCDCARIDHSQFPNISRQFYNALQKIKGERKQDERTAMRIYEAWTKIVGKMQTLDFEVEVDETDHRHSPGALRYQEAFAPGHVSAGAQTETRRGTLVFTGLPSRRKHLEFVFLDPAEAKGPLEVSPAVWTGFLDVHEGQEKASSTWEYWRDKFEKGTISGIPVFYLEDGAGGVKAFGLAQMFKLAQEASTHEMIAESSASHLNNEVLDLAERLFGRVESRKGNGQSRDDGGSADASLKGRVSFGLARLKGAPPDPLRLDPTILGTPKPSYFPAYVRQVDFADGYGSRLASQVGPTGGSVLAQYRTYMRWNERCEELRGWKRYPARGPGKHQPPKLNSAQARNTRTQVSLNPLYRKDGLVFEGLVRFHNLRPVELGALVWALEWGGNARLRHGMGMGKAFGWGQVAVRVLRDNPKTEVRPNSPGATAPDLDGCQAEFAKSMDDWVRRERVSEGWAKTPQIRRLLAMADPTNAERNQPLTYMTLDPEKGPDANEFLQAKKRGLVLREYLDAADQGNTVPVPPLAAMKGFGSTGSATRPSPQRPEPAAALFRGGDRVLNVEEHEYVVVIADQVTSDTPVRVRFDDGMEDEVSPGALKR